MFKGVNFGTIDFPYISNTTANQGSTGLFKQVGDSRCSPLPKAMPIFIIDARKQISD